MDIVIPTYGRVDRQITYDNLPPRWREQVRLVVRPEEEYEHQKRGRSVIILPDGVEEIRDVRHWLIHDCHEIDSHHLVMMDDDLVFSARREDQPTKFRPMIDEDYDDMFACLNWLFEQGFAHVAVSHREGANRNTDTFVNNTRYMRVLGYNRYTLKQERIIARTRVMEDFDVNLQLLRAGFQSVLANLWVHNQGGSDVSGGCSTYRTDEVQEEAAKTLAHLHPEFVTTVVKKTKTSWGGKERTDVRIQWKKAYESSQR